MNISNLPSKTKIDKAGQRLLKQSSNEEYNEALETLSLWRSYHAGPLSTFAQSLKTRVKKISSSNNSVVAQRLKRTPSIV